MEASPRQAGSTATQTSALFLALLMSGGLFEFFAHMSELRRFTSLQQKVQRA